MADIQWFVIRSSHAVRLPSDRVGRTWAKCGRTKLNATLLDMMPAGRSCETCLRVIAREADA